MRLTESELELVARGISTLDDVLRQRQERLHRTRCLMRMQPEQRRRLDEISDEEQRLSVRWLELLEDQSPFEWVSDRIERKVAVPDHTDEITAIKSRLLVLHRESLSIWHTVDPRTPEEYDAERREALLAATAKSAYRLCDWSFLHAEPYDPGDARG